MKILFATDGSDSALAALEFFLRFPVPADSELVITTVIDQAAFADQRQERISRIIADDRTEPPQGALQAEASSEDEAPSLNEEQVSLCREVKTHLESVSARLQSAGWSPSIEIRSGHPTDQICQAAEALAADLILVGSHGHSGLRRYLLGSVSAGVLQYAHCSVLLVPHPDLGEHRLPDADAPLRFLLAHDGSEPAVKAVDFCASLPLKGRATLILLRVLELVTLYRLDLRQRLSPVFQEEKRSAQQQLERAAERLRQLTPEVEIRLLESEDLGGTILAEAEEQSSDLILLGFKGRSAVKRMLVGSVVGRIATHAQCAVLVVR